MLYICVYIYYCVHKGEPITFFEKNCKFPEHKQERCNLNIFKYNNIISV